MHYAARLLQQRKESRAVPRIASKRRIDASARAPEGAQRLRRHAFELRVLLHDEKTLEERGGVAIEHIGRMRLQQFPHPPELSADLRYVGIPRRENFGTYVLEQYGIQLSDRLRCAEIRLHQLLAGAPVRSGGIAELSCQALLEVEQQPILAACRGVVQAHAQVLEQSVMPMRLARFLRCNQAALRQFRPGTSQSTGSGDPKDHLQVAQAAGCFLEIGLEAVGAVLEFGMALLLLQTLCLEKYLSVEAVLPCAIKTGEETAVSGELSRFKEAGHHGHVLPRFLDALGDRAHAVTQLEPGVPEPSYEFFDLGRQAGGSRVLQQHQHVDVGMRIELSAPVAADREQRKGCRQPELPPHVLQDAVDQAAMLSQHHRTVCRFAKSCLQCGALRLHAGLQAGERGATVRKCRGRGQHGVSALAEGAFRRKGSGPRSPYR